MPRNIAQTQNIRNDTQNNDMSVKQRTAANILGNAATLGTGAWLNNSLKPNLYLKSLYVLIEFLTIILKVILHMNLLTITVSIK